MAREKTPRTRCASRERESGWSARRITRKHGARPVRPVGYRLVVLPRTPQAEIDVCLACPLPDCRGRGCPLEKLPRTESQDDEM